VVTSYAKSPGRRGWLIAALVAIEIGLIILHLINGARTHFWNIDREEGVGTLVAALLLASNVLVLMHCRKFAADRKDRWKWLMTAILFGALAVDELSEVHSWLPEYLWQKSGGTGTTVLGGLVIWVVFLSPVVLAVIIALVRFFFKVLSKSARMFALTGLACWCIVLLVELTGKTDILPWLIETAIEEFCEMLGSTLFLLTFLKELARLQNSAPRKAEKAAVPFKSRPR
jgi:hypothetical protein